MNKEFFYLTTPIYYPNAAPHIGTAYTTIVADCLTRFQRLLGVKAYFLTGTDEHGQKIEKAAAEKGITPQAHVDEMFSAFKQVWERLEIANDDFIRTTEERHETGVVKIFQQLKDRGLIFKDTYEGWYCVADETFWTQAQVVEGKCPNPECGREVVWMKEEGYFFKLSRFQNKLLEYLDQHPDFIQPQSRFNETYSFIKRGLQDLCVSRKGLKWGVPIPGDEEHSIYVWIDALSNYLTAIGYPDRENYLRYWPADVQLVGKDILRFHAIIWPALLMALELPLPKIIYAHGWIVSRGEKISKSRGARNINEMIKDFSADAIRYFLLKQAPFGQDMEYSEEALVDRYNKELGNELGNLLNRTLTMLENYFGGLVPEKQTATELETQLENLEFKNRELYREHFSALRFREALAALWEIVVELNTYAEKTSPWKLAKDPSNRERLQTILYSLSEGIRQVVVMVYPIIPVSAQKMWEQLGMEGSLEQLRWEALSADPLKAGKPVKKGMPVFPRLEIA